MYSEIFWNVHSYVKSPLLLWLHPTLMIWSWFEQNLISISLGCFHTSFCFPCWLVSQKIFYIKSLIHIYSSSNIWPHCGPTLPPGSWFWQFWIFTDWGGLHITFWKFFKIFASISNYLLLKRLRSLNFTISNSLCLSFVWKNPSGSEEYVKIWKKFTDRRSDGQQTNHDQKSPL